MMNDTALDLTAWIRFAVKSKVKELSLELQSSVFFYTLPQVLYSNSSLTSLSIKRCNVVPQSTIEWQSLTLLVIGGVELNEHVIQKILSGCPVLDRLTLSSCWGFKHLDLNSKSVYGLRLSDSEDGNNEDLLEISAPYLHSLDVSICPIGKKLELTNIASLVSLGIHFNVLDDSVELMNNTIELLEKTNHVKEVVLGGAFVEVVSELVMQDRQLPQSSKRDCLVLETLRDEDCIPGILGLLESYPNLETLCIECLESYEKSARTWGPVARDDLCCDLLNLKTVRLNDFADPNLGCEPMLTMARILLKRATALRKMEIDAYENLTKYSSDFDKMSQTVVSYPKSSEKAVIILLQ